ncbi:MAG: hypothetical protein ACRDDZ_05520 [Marinifilaceae bacterium]
MTTLEEYKVIAQKNDFTYVDSETEIKLFGMINNGISVHDKFAFMQKDKIFYYAYDSFAAQMYMNTLHSGIYTPFAEQSDVSCEIEPRLSPILNMLFNSNSIKTGQKDIDKSACIKTTDWDKLQKYITPQTIASYISLAKQIQPLKLVIGKGREVIPAFPEFEDTTMIGLKTNYWLKSEEVLQQFNAAISLINAINKK